MNTLLLFSVHKSCSPDFMTFKVDRLRELLKFREEGPLHSLNACVGTYLPRYADEEVSAANDRARLSVASPRYSSVVMTELTLYLTSDRLPGTSLADYKSGAGIAGTSDIVLPCFRTTEAFQRFWFCTTLCHHPASTLFHNSTRIDYQLRPWLESHATVTLLEKSCPYRMGTWKQKRRYRRHFRFRFRSPMIKERLA